MISVNVIILGKAVLGFSDYSRDEIIALLQNSPTSILIATKILLEKWHPTAKNAIWLISSEILKRESARLQDVWDIAG